MLALAALCALAACAKSGTTAPPAGGAVGFVRMTELIKHHPLFAQLSQYDDGITALNLTGTVPQAVAADPAIASAEADLQKQLEDAANRTKKLLDEKSREYQQREQRAIADALRASGSAPGVASIQQQIGATAQNQSATAASQAQRDYDTFRQTLENQSNAELDAAQKVASQRAQRAFRAEQDELQAKESQLTFDMANRDAPERLSLRTKLSSLVLDDADREATKAKLDALDRKESDALAAMKNRDQQTLATLNAQLRDQVGREVKIAATDIRSRTLAKLKARQDEIRAAFSGRPPVESPAQSVSVNSASLPPAVKAKIEKLHGDYQKQFNADAQATIEDFNRTRDDLKRRYDQLHATDAAASGDASAQIAALSKKRDDLYAEIVAQIGREVRLIAQQKGVSVVVTDPIATPGGVDLTPDALKDIESLHE